MSRVRMAVAVLAVAFVSTGCMHSQQSAARLAAAKTAQTAGIGVNSYLWRASLDTLAFMPLASADPWGGTIITEWYVNPSRPNERLRADGLNVTVFKQIKDASGQWVDAPVSNQTDIDIENSILTRARQLRLSNLN